MFGSEVGIEFKFQSAIRFINFFGPVRNSTIDIKMHYDLDPSKKIGRRLDGELEC